ncbi:MAG: S8 family serine peptidase [Erythrobacter sp.]|nr:MAG: S8 family serine peptidase [Erythrobacter sp.]
MRIWFLLTAASFLLYSSASANAQVAVGDVQVGLPGTQQLPGRVLDPLLQEADNLERELARQALDLARDRVRRINRLVRRNQSLIERDARGEPARRGELMVMDVDAQAISRAETEGYRVLGREQLDGLGLAIWRLALPPGVELAEGEERLSRLLPDATIDPDNLYEQSGTSPSAGHSFYPVPERRLQATSVRVGMIDGAPASGTGVVTVRSFAEGGGEASDHGSAIASLLRSAGASRIYAADVYGSDPAGGNALAIVRALAWLHEQGVRVVSVSLVGPHNAILSRAIRGAHASGMVVVAAVGNDGPAAPPAYPASYDGVVAVTAVDRRERALIEAGRALHLDYAAPGADIFAWNRRGRQQRVRGTSYATPLVAGRIAVALDDGSNWRSVLDSEAHDLGPRGPDETYGRGLVCRDCGAAR